MTEPLTFVLACLAILATPGPTNTLLATSGAVAGFTPSLALIAAELGGYAISIISLAVIVSPLLGASPTLSIALRLGCGGYLVWSAIHLWREGSSPLVSTKPVSFRRVFIATLLNPKGVIFAMVLVPHLGEGHLIEAAPYLAALAGMMAVVATSWVGGGALIGASTKGFVSSGLIRKVGASVLALFGVLFSSSVFLSW